MRTRQVTEAEAKIYLKKAEEFYQTMLESCRERRWNSAALAAIHCAISATDALVGFKAKMRSAGVSHYQVIDLLRLCVKDERLEQQANRLAQILDKKTLVEYEGRDFREREAASVVQDVGRYFDWVKLLI